MVILWGLLAKSQKSQLEESALQILLPWAQWEGKAAAPLHCSVPVPPVENLMAFTTHLTDHCGSSRSEKPCAWSLVLVGILADSAEFVTYVLLFPVEHVS